MNHGAFVISLDFEKHWGVFDHVHGPEDSYWKNLEAVDAVVPRLLETFSKHSIHVTWSTVGLLFAGTKEEQTAWIPTVKPAYRDATLDPYVVQVGQSEADDKVHFGRTLVERVMATPGQEIGTHTFAHVYALAEGMTEEAFDHDLRSAVKAGQARGITPRSIVFPRNQYNPAFRDALLRNGVDTYRGNPVYWPYNAKRSGGLGGKAIRLGRLVDSYVSNPAKCTQAWTELEGDDGLVNVRASHFLRPYSRRLSALSRLHAASVRRAVRYAAKNNRLYHLWWHPHNFGRNLEQNIAQLEGILAEVAACRETYGMQSLTMVEAADLYRQSPAR